MRLSRWECRLRAWLRHSDRQQHAAGHRESVGFPWMRYQGPTGLSPFACRDSPISVGHADRVPGRLARRAEVLAAEAPHPLRRTRAARHGLDLHTRGRVLADAPRVRPRRGVASLIGVPATGCLAAARGPPLSHSLSQTRPNRASSSPIPSSVNTHGLSRFAGKSRHAGRRGALPHTREVAGSNPAAPIPRVLLMGAFSSAGHAVRGPHSSPLSHSLSQSVGWSPGRVRH